MESVVKYTYEYKNFFIQIPYFFKKVGNLSKRYSPSSFGMDSNE